jgi:putative glutamine amidotransferase
MSARPRIAIPLPLSGNPEYVERSLPQYEHAIEMAGGEPVRVPLDLPPAETMKIVERCDAVLLPGASADVDPAKYDAVRHEKTAPADVRRDTVDELLLQDAYNMRKPILGICYGLQILNVYRTGSLIQHIDSRINHEAGRKVAVAHTVEIEPGSKLAEIVGNAQDSFGSEESLRSAEQIPRGGKRAGIDNQNEPFNVHSEQPIVIPVNSSHHQAAEVVGDGLRVAARSPHDRIVEALEGTSPEQFVLAVQWHPERSVDEDEPSRAIFRSFVEAAKTAHQKLRGEFETIG